MDREDFIVWNGSPGGVLIGVQFASESESRVGCRCPIRFTTTSRLTSGLPGQFCVMAENKRGARSCSLCWFLVGIDRQLFRAAFHPPASTTRLSAGGGCNHCLRPHQRSAYESRDETGFAAD